MASLEETRSIEKEGGGEGGKEVLASCYYSFLFIWRKEKKKEEYKKKIKNTKPNTMRTID